MDADGDVLESVLNPLICRVEKALGNEGCFATNERDDQVELGQLDRGDSTTLEFFHT